MAPWYVAGPLPPRVNHVGGAALFGVGWSVADTCPGPLAVIVGEGKLAALAVVAGVVTGIRLHGVWTRGRTP